ncbi:hypothetical protein BDW75DRAFT_251902 [Aspergillus navahoensis]
MQAPEVPALGRRKPRACPYCKRSFRRYEHLQRHMRLPESGNFLDTNEKPYECDCGASFSRRDLLKRHQSIGHEAIPQSTPSTAIHDTSNPELRTDDSPFQNTSAGPTSRNSQFGDEQHHGNPLFSSQDLLVFQNLEMFSSNPGLDYEWYLPSEPSIVQIFAGDTGSNVLRTSSTTYTHNGHPSGPELTLSKLPTERENVAEFGVLTLPILTITHQHRERLCEALMLYRPTETSNNLPSCHSLSRFINGFFDGFYPHFPMVHIPTFKVDECEPEVLLAMCALGAEFRHENRKAASLFYAAKDLLQEKVRETEQMAVERTFSTLGGSGTYSHQHVPTSAHDRLRYRKTMCEARCAFLLIAFAAWQREESIAREAFILQSFLARCVRECQLEENEQSLDANADTWHLWIQEETDRRVKLFSFAILNLQSIVFGTPPVILADEINVRLPCSCLEWIAPNEQKWNFVRKPGHREQMLFQEALCHVLKNPEDPGLKDTQPIPSPLANYVLIHAIIQQILLAYHTLGPYKGVNDTLLNGQKEAMRNALHAWTSLWQRAPESSLDPRNPNGPVTFTSTALLGVAYIRLGFNLGSYRILRSLDANEIATRLLQIPRLPSGPHLLPAILHATHALSIPVKLGVNFVARSHAFVWSVQHSLCGLEFSIFLSKWLHCIADCQNRETLDDHEARLINWISDIVEEGRTSGDNDLWPRPSDLSDCTYLGVAVVKLWARLIRGNEQCLFLGVVGDGLDIYARACERDSVNFQTAIYV